MTLGQGFSESLQDAVLCTARSVADGDPSFHMSISDRRALCVEVGLV